MLRDRPGLHPSSGRAINPKKKRRFKSSNSSTRSKLLPFAGNILFFPRSRRIAIFHSYLNYLAADFHQLHRKLRILSLYAPTDRADLSRLLLEQRLLFATQMFRIRLRLLLFRFGWKPVDVTSLVDLVENLRLQVSELSSGLAAPTATATA